MIATGRNELSRNGRCTWFFAWVTNVREDDQKEERYDDGTRTEETELLAGARLHQHFGFLTARRAFATLAPGESDLSDSRHRGASRVVRHTGAAQMSSDHFGHYWVSRRCACATIQCVGAAFFKAASTRPAYYFRQKNLSGHQRLVACPMTSRVGRRAAFRPRPVHNLSEQWNTTVWDELAAGADGVVTRRIRILMKTSMPSRSI